MLSLLARAMGRFVDVTQRDLSVTRAMGRGLQMLSLNTRYTRRIDQFARLYGTI